MTKLYSYLWWIHERAKDSPYAHYGSFISSFLSHKNKQTNKEKINDNDDDDDDDDYANDNDICISSLRCRDCIISIIKSNTLPISCILYIGNTDLQCKYVLLDNEN